MVFMRRRALLLMGLLVRLRRARGGLRQHVGCGASMRGAVQACVVRCTRTVRGVESARTARPPRQLRRRARWRLWRARADSARRRNSAQPLRAAGTLTVSWDPPYPGPETLTQTLTGGGGSSGGGQALAGGSSGGGQALAGPMGDASLLAERRALVDLCTCCAASQTVGHASRRAKIMIIQRGMPWYSRRATMTSLTRLEQRATEVNIGRSEPKTRLKMSNHALSGYARIMLALSATPPAVPKMNEIRP